MLIGKFLAVLMALSTSFFGVSTVPTEITAEHVISETVAPKISEPVKTAPTTYKGPEAPKLSEKDQQWIFGVLNSYKLPMLDGLKITVTDVDNCGSEMSSDKTGGGCYYPDFKILMLSPSIMRTEAGIVTLLHEYGHAIGLENECDAENFSHNLFTSNLWSYPTCMTK